MLKEEKQVHKEDILTTLKEQAEVFLSTVNRLLEDKKEEKKVVLFTTHDGVDIKKGHKSIIHIFNKRAAVSYRDFIDKIEGQNLENLIFFHYPKNLEEYIIMNKPLLSLNDLLSVWDEGKPFDNGKYSPMFKSFTELAKQKLK